MNTCFSRATEEHKGHSTELRDTVVFDICWAT